MRYVVYILYSGKLNKFYVGYSSDLSRRLIQHNTGKSTYTSSGIPWTVLWSCNKETIGAATKLERKLKNLTRIRKVRFMLKYHEECGNCDMKHFLKSFRLW